MNANYIDFEDIKDGDDDDEDELEGYVEGLTTNG